MKLVDVWELRRNIETKERLLADIQMSQAELQETLEQVRKQRVAIQDLGTPIIDIWEHVLTLPLIGFIDTQRALNMTQTLLHRIVSSGARCVIVDMTGIEIMDTMTAGHIIRMLRAAETLGAYCVVTGIGPELALTLTELGIDFGRMRMLRSLRDGLRACLVHLEGEQMTEPGQGGVSERMASPPRRRR